MRSPCFRLRAQFYHLLPFLLYVTRPGVLRQTWSSISAPCACFSLLFWPLMSVLVFRTKLGCPLWPLVPDLNLWSGHDLRSQFWPVQHPPSPAIVPQRALSSSLLGYAASTATYNTFSGFPGPRLWSRSCSPHSGTGLPILHRHHTSILPSALTCVMITTGINHNRHLNFIYLIFIYSFSYILLFYDITISQY